MFQRLLSVQQVGDATSNKAEISQHLLKQQQQQRKYFTRDFCLAFSLVF